MNNDLPKVFQNEDFDIELDMTDKCYVDNRCYEKEQRNIRQVINQIFASSNFVYKKTVHIKLKNNDSFTATVVGKNGAYLVTMDHGNILIDNIKDITI